MANTEQADDRAALSLTEDRTGFEALFSLHHHDVYVAMWLVTRSRQEAEEILQEAFLRLWERWDRVGAMEDPEGYLYRTAMNVFRSRRRRSTLALHRPARVAEPDDLLESIERREVLVQALGSLTPRERAAVVMTDVLGFSSEEAGRALSIRSATVRVLASRGAAV